MSLIDKVQPHVPGEEIRYVVTGQTGLNPMLRFLSLLLNVFNKTRVIVYTDKRVAVFAGSQVRGKRGTPRKHLYDLPVGTVLGHGGGSWSRVTVGQERVWIPRANYGILDKANGAPTAD